VQAIKALSDRANKGNQQALSNLRHLLETCPEVWQEVGDLARHTELAWLAIVTGDNSLVRESVKKRIAKLKEDLGGPSPTTIERLLIDRVVASWLAVAHAEVQAASPGNCSPAQLAMRLRRLESAQRNHLGAMRVLAKLRATVPQGLAPLSSVRLFTADRHQA
jgi:hypothetical protein